MSHLLKYPSRNGVDPRPPIKSDTRTVTTHTGRIRLTSVTTPAGPWSDRVQRRLWVVVGAT